MEQILTRTAARPWRQTLASALNRLLRGSALLLALGASSAYAHTVIATVGVGSSPQDAAVNAVTNRIYVTNTNSNTVSVIDGATNAVTAAVPVGTWPRGVAVNATTNRVYVTNQTTNNLTVLDGTSNATLATIATGLYPSGVAVNPNTNRIYVSNSDSNSLSVIDGASNTVIATIPVGTTPRQVDVNPNTNRIYVANVSSNNYSVIDGSANAVIATIPAGVNPYRVAVNPSTNRLYVSNTGSNNVMVFDGATNALVATVPVGSAPKGIAVNPVINRIYVTNDGSSNIMAIDGASNAVTDTIPVGVNPLRIAVNPATARVYVPNFGSNNVTVIATEDATPQSGWWWNPSRPGQGFMIERQGNRLLIVGGYYTSTGRATWYYSYGNMTGTSYTGDFTTYANGQTLTGPYVPPVGPTSVGTISLSFTDAAHGTVTVPGGSPMAIERYSFATGGVGAAPAPSQAQTGAWWNVSESGRGFAVEIQNGQIFLAGYMYDGSGNPIWYTSGGVMSSPNSYSGNWMQWANGPTLGGAYVAPIVINTNVGSVAVTFSSPTTATLVLPDGRNIPLIRFIF